MHGNSHFSLDGIQLYKCTNEGFISVTLRFQKKNGSCMEVRLNTPHSKFEMTNMADNQVDLTPEDIPGASFSEEEIGKLTIAG